MYDGLQQCWELPCLHESYNGLHPISCDIAHEATASQKMSQTVQAMSQAPLSVQRTARGCERYGAARGHRDSEAWTRHCSASFRHILASGVLLGMRDYGTALWVSSQVTAVVCSSASVQAGRSIRLCGWPPKGTYVLFNVAPAVCGKPPTHTELVSQHP